MTIKMKPVLVPVSILSTPVEMIDTDDTIIGAAEKGIVVDATEATAVATAVSLLVCISSLAGDWKATKF